MTNPNVLFLVVDSLRSDVMTDKWETETPRLDELMQDGIQFGNCFSQGISTAPAMTAMLTGRYPLDYGGHWHLDNEQRTFAQLFNENGYRTGAIHSNPYVSARRNFDRGFDRFEEDVVAFEPDEGLEAAPEKLLRLASRLSRIVSRTPYTPAESVNKDMLSFVRGASEPWFLWTQYMDVHGPYLGGDDFSYRNKFRSEWLWRKAAVRDPDSITEKEHAELRENYQKEVEYIDRAIGELLDELASSGQLENTFVVVTGDHGDEFYEHGRYGHGNLPYDELTHVPLIVRPPTDSELPRGKTVDDLVRCMDILPTIIDSINLNIPDSHQERLEGKSLLPLVNGKRLNRDPLVITEKRVRGEDSLRIGLRTEEWKYLFDGTTDERYLYNLDQDSEETTDVLDENPDVSERFEDLLQNRFERISETSSNIEVPEMDTGAGVEQRLKALGYRE